MLEFVMMKGTTKRGNPWSKKVIKSLALNLQQKFEYTEGEVCWIESLAHQADLVEKYIDHIEPGWAHIETVCSSVMDLPGVDVEILVQAQDRLLASLNDFIRILRQSRT